MTNKIHLTSSMRSNLLSLQHTTKLQAITQERLATGLKINSAIDSPSAYYTAQSLSNRASDLSALLDSLSQGIQTIKATNTTIETASDFLAQAASVATQALESAKIPSKDWFESQENVAAVVTNFSELKTALASGAKGDFVVYGNIEATERINLGEGQNLVGIGYYGDFDTEVDKFSQITFDMERDGLYEGIYTYGNNLTIADLSIKAVTQKPTGSTPITMNATSVHILKNLDLFFGNIEQDEYSINTSVQANGIYGGNDISFYGNNYVCTNYKETSKALYLNGLGGVEGNLYGNLNIEVNSSASRGITSKSFNVYGESQINIYSGCYGTRNCTVNLFDNAVVNIKAIPSATYSFGMDYSTVNINDSSKFYIEANTAFAGNSGLTSNTNINTSKAEVVVNSYAYFSKNHYDTLTFNAVEGAQMNVNGKVYEAKKEVSDNTMDGNNMPDGFEEVAGAKAKENPSLAWLKELNSSRTPMGYNKELDNSQYNALLNQYDSLIKDGSYKGINLLKNDKLNMRFNESGSSALEISGVDASATSLGLKTTSWQTQTDIAQALTEISSALNSLRNISAQFGNYYSILTTREDFTENLINVLEEGADKLTLADMSEESANMLSLQTRQQLATNALSLSSQASQSILKLF